MLSSYDSAAACEVINLGDVRVIDNSGTFTKCGLDSITLFINK